MIPLEQLQGLWQDGENRHRMYTVEGERVAVYDDSPNKVAQGTQYVVHPLSVDGDEIFWGRSKQFSLRWLKRDTVEWVSRTKSDKKGFWWYRYERRRFDDHAHACSATRSSKESFDWSSHWCQSDDSRGWNDPAWQPPRDGTYSSGWQEGHRWRSEDVQPWNAKWQAAGDDFDPSRGRDQDESHIEKTIQQLGDDVSPERTSRSCVPGFQQPCGSHLSNERPLEDPSHTSTVAHVDVLCKPEPGLLPTAFATAQAWVGTSKTLGATPPQGTVGSTWIALKNVIIRASLQVSSAEIVRVPEGALFTQAEPWKVLEFGMATVVRMKVACSVHSTDPWEGYLTVVAHDGNREHFFVALTMNIDHLRVGMRALAAGRPVHLDAGTNILKLPKGSRGAMWVALLDMAMVISLENPEQTMPLTRGSEFWQLDPWTVDDEGALHMRILQEDHWHFHEGWLKLPLDVLQGNLGKGEGKPCMALRSEPTAGRAWCPVRHLQ